MSSDSDLQSALESLQWTNYTSLVIITAVVYDYLLVFTREVNYVWIRYIGLSWVILDFLWGSAFLSGTAEICLATFQMVTWGKAIFFAAADYCDLKLYIVMMILRVYAMWSQSKRILGVLLLLYVPRTYTSITTAQVGNFNTCATIANNTPPTLATQLVDPSLRFVLSVVLFMLAVIQTIKQSVGMFKATKQWKPNKYMQQLVTDGFLYFLVYLFLNIGSMLENALTYTIIVDMVSFMVVIPMMPRFIISMRELYDRDCCSRWKGIDSRFGVLSQPAASTNVVMSAIAFADVNFQQGESQVVGDGAEDSEVIPSEMLRDGANQVVEAEAGNSQAIGAEDRAGYI
ncbi:hypothetical protein V8E55_003820 [Tylopilus felleus]